MKNKLLRFFLLLALILGIVSAGLPVQAAGPALPPGSLFNPLAPGTAGLWDKLGGSGGLLENSVYVIAVSGTDVYLGGSFVNANGNPAADYLIKWDGSTWSALGSNGAGNGALKSPVNTIVVKGSDVYVGGNFTNLNNNGVVLNAADYVAKWDGSAWSALGSNGAGDGALNGSVIALAFNGSDLYAGGSFIDVNNNGTSLWNADYIARWDGSAWSALGSNGAGNGSLNTDVHALAVRDGSLYVGGGFSNVMNGSTSLPEADYIAGWDGSSWFALSSNGAGNGALNSVVLALAANSNGLYAGGGFSNVSDGGTALPAADYLARWDGTHWSALGSGLGGNGSLNFWVNTLAVSGTDVYAGGYFTNVNNRGVSLITADYVARWNGSNWGAVGNFDAGTGSLNAEVFALAAGSNKLYAGGNFFNVDNNGVQIPAADRVAVFETIQDATPPQVQSIARAGASPTQADSVDFTVTFSKPVANVFDTDFSLAAGTNLLGAAINGVSGSGTTFTVNVSTGTGSGTLRLDLVDDDSILDWAANSLGGPGAGNGSFSSGEIYQVRPYLSYIPLARKN